MKRLAKLLIGVLAAVIAFGILSGIDAAHGLLVMINVEDSAFNWVALLVSLALLTGLIFYFISPWIINKVVHLARLMLRSSQRVPFSVIMIGTGGIAAGLILANLLSLALVNIPVVGPYLPLVVNLLFAYFGMQLATGKSEEIRSLFSRRERSRAAASDKLSPAGDAEAITDEHGPEAVQERVVIGAVRKVLDTSVIIDGRIFDVCATGFLEGPLVVPVFVLEELRNLADLAEPQKRLRGRRGLDILNQIQQLDHVEVQIVDIDFPEESGVDDKLMKLTQQLGGKLLTLDYNLSKICTLRKIAVLNINELANALRAVLLPGEEVSVTVLKVGKEPGQGVAYLEDGTMMVIEGAARQVNQTITVTVTSTLQTAAGRMIFARC